MTELGSIYGTDVDGSNTLVIDFSNVDICGNLKVKGGLAIDNSFGVSGELLTSQGPLGTPIWTAPATPDFLLFDIGAQQNLTANVWNFITPTYSFGGTAGANNSNNITIDPITGIITFANTGSYVINVNFQGYWGLCTNINLQLHPGAVTAAPTSTTMEAFTNIQRSSGVTREPIGFSGLPVNITVANTTKRFWINPAGGSNGFLQNGNGGVTCGSIIRIV